MVLGDIYKGHQVTRDSVSSNPEILPIPKISRSSIKYWSEPTLIYNRDIDNSWTVGSSTNAIVGTWTGTAGGGQLVVGPTSNTQQALRVIPSKDSWVNFLRDTSTNTVDTNGEGLLLASSTATINTTTHRIDLDTGDFVEWQVALNNSNYSGVEVIFDESPQRTNIDFSAGGGDSFPMTFPFTLSGEQVDLKVSSDGGSTWEGVTNGVVHSFATAGSDIKVRLEAVADGLYWKTKDNNGTELPILVRLIR